MDWEYFKLTDNRVAQFEDRGNNEYEIVVLVSIQNLKIYLKVQLAFLFTRPQIPTHRMS